MPHHFSETVIRWYHTNKRDLPWRNIQNPYAIWLSEVILQQTRVVQGMDYYHAFIEHYPTVKQLADAKEEEVLALWQGLGYYSRARNLHKAAQQVMTDFNGRFPTTYTDLIQLAGIGPYTASAISSFSSGEKRAVVDGNVYRLFARYFGIEDDISGGKAYKTFLNKGMELMPAAAAADFNQAVMEFGALQCVPKSPNCDCCPLSIDCYALNNSKISSLPVKLKKTKVSQRYLHYFFIGNEKGLFLSQRKGKGIWENMYDFFCIETESKEEAIDNLLKSNTTLFEILQDQGAQLSTKSAHKARHVLSHQVLNTSFFTITIEDIAKEHILDLLPHLQWISWEDVKKLPKPVLISNYLAALR